MHDLQFESENGVNVMFCCLNCGEVISFNKPGIGVPAAVKVAGAWNPAKDPEQWLGPCVPFVMRALQVGKLKKNILELVNGVTE